jgi:hypothetical protein
MKGLRPSFSAHVRLGERGAPVDSLSEIWEISAEEWREKKSLRNILGVKELS